VAHLAQDKTRLVNRVRRLRGQIEAIERALDKESGCAEILQLLAGARGAMNGLMMEVIEGHIREHIVSPAIKDEALRMQGAEELQEVIRTYLK
jgi:DNA-binding FrmR family transcriptional regulator